jgi:hypothetical protein
MPFRGRGLSFLYGTHKRLWDPPSLLSTGTEGSFPRRLEFIEFTLYCEQHAIVFPFYSKTAYEYEKQYDSTLKSTMTKICHRYNTSIV